MLTHVTTTLELMEKGVPVDLVFQSIGGTEATNRSFGVTLACCARRHEAARALKRGTVGHNVMYFETGQGSALSADAHHGVDQQTCEARAYAVARAFEPLLVNTVVGFIGPEYLYDGKEILRAALEDHFCGKLMGLPMGVDVCYTNHAEADQDDMDIVLTALAAAGVTYVMGVPGADDVMLSYQSTSFHDALYRARGVRPEARARVRGVARRHAASPTRPAGCCRHSSGHPLIARQPCAGRSRRHERRIREIPGRSWAPDAGAHRARPRGRLAADARGAVVRAGPRAGARCRACAISTWRRSRRRLRALGLDADRGRKRGAGSRDLSAASRPRAAARRGLARAAQAAIGGDAVRSRAHDRRRPVGDGVAAHAPAIGRGVCCRMSRRLALRLGPIVAGGRCARGARRRDRRRCSAPPCDRC